MPFLLHIPKPRRDLLAMMMPVCEVKLPPLRHGECAENRVIKDANVAEPGFTFAGEPVHFGDLRPDLGHDLFGRHPARLCLRRGLSPFREIPKPHHCEGCDALVKRGPSHPDLSGGERPLKTLCGAAVGEEEMFQNFKDRPLPVAGSDKLIGSNPGNRSSNLTVKPCQI